MSQVFLIFLQVTEQEVSALDHLVIVPDWNFISCQNFPLDLFGSEFSTISVL